MAQLPLPKPSKASALLSRPLLWRTGLFLLLFVVYSGILGPRIIGSGVLNSAHFDIYGSLGKSLLFAAIAFGLLVRDKLKTDLGNWQRNNLWWLAGSLISFGVCIRAINHLVVQQDLNLPLSLSWVLLSHASLIISILLGLLAVFGLQGLYKLKQHFGRQMLVAVGLGIAFLVLLSVVYAAWKPLAGIVLYSVHWLFSLIGLPSEIIPPRSLLFDKFGIEIAQYCSGIESIALFSGLFGLIAVLDWDKFNHRKLLAAFPIALTLLFACNILRVFVLIAAGYYINPQLAFTLFHTYAGMVFFLIYSGIFWGVMYKRLLVVPVRPSKTPTI